MYLGTYFLGIGSGARWWTVAGISSDRVSRKWISFRGERRDVVR